MLLAVNLIAIISNWYLFNLSGADWKLHLHGRVFYEGNCHEGKLKWVFFFQLFTIMNCTLVPTICYFHYDTVL